MHENLSVTLSLAVLGAVLGIINTIHALQKDKIKLKVKPKWVILPQAPGLKHIGVEVINLGFIPVTISEIGFKISYFTDKRLVLPNPVLLDGGDFPRRLEPRSSFSIYILDILDDPNFHKSKYAYAKTDCEKIFKGKSPAFKQAIRMNKSKLKIYN